MKRILAIMAILIGLLALLCGSVSAQDGAYVNFVFKAEARLANATEVSHQVVGSSGVNLRNEPSAITNPRRFLDSGTNVMIVGFYDESDSPEDSWDYVLVYDSTGNIVDYGWVNTVAANWQNAPGDSTFQPLDPPCHLTNGTQKVETEVRFNEGWSFALASTGCNAYAEGWDGSTAIMRYWVLRDYVAGSQIDGDNGTYTGIQTRDSELVVNGVFVSNDWAEGGVWLLPTNWNVADMSSTEDISMLADMGLHKEQSMIEEGLAHNFIWTDLSGTQHDVAFGDWADYLPPGYVADISCQFTEPVLQDVTGVVIETPVEANNFLAAVSLGYPGCWTAAIWQRDSDEAIEVSYIEGSEYGLTFVQEFEVYMFPATWTFDEVQTWTQARHDELFPNFAPGFQEEQFLNDAAPAASKRSKYQDR